MDAAPYLREIARLFGELKLEAVLIGNAAAALQGAPVTTVDIDFLFRKTPSNITKLKKFARAMGMVIYNPFYPAAQMFRLSRDSDQLQLDFCMRIDGIRSYESLRSRAGRVAFDGRELLVANLGDVIKSKRAAGRPQDLAILVTLEETYARAQAQSGEKKKSSKP